MNSNYILKEKIKKLKLGLVLHSLIYFILDLIHIVIYFRIIWMTKQELTIFYIEIFILCFFSIIPMSLLLVLSFFKSTKKLFNTLQAFSKLFFYIIFFNGIIISINTWNNARLLTTFFHYCPFNFNYKDIYRIFNNFEINKEKEIKKQCKYRRCFLNNTFIKDNKNVNNYICNLKEKDKTIDCIELKTIDDDSKIKIEIENYVNYCQSYTKMYKCEKKGLYINYNISYDHKCPNKSDVSFNYAFAFLFILIDSFFCSIPWLYEYYSYKDLIIFLSLEIITANRNAMSERDTNNTSKINNNNNNSGENGSNQENVSIDFERQHTEIIIVDNNINKNNSFENINDKVKDKNILNINSNRIDNSTYKGTILNNNNEINNKNIETENSKSENQLVDNKNKNIFKIINQNNNLNINKKNEEEDK